jgi:hypothetical protein
LPSPSCVRYATLLRHFAVGGFHVGSDFATKALWLVGSGSDCRHGARAGRVRAGGSTDRGHGASAITTPRTAHGSANAAHGPPCCAGLPARRSSRRNVITFHLRGCLSGRPRHGQARFVAILQSRSDSRPASQSERNRPVSCPKTSRCEPEGTRTQGTN